jgi:hypothetical protein
MRLILHLSVAYGAFAREFEEVSISPLGDEAQRYVVRREQARKANHESLVPAEFGKLEPSKPFRGQAIPSQIYFNHKKSKVLELVRGTSGLRMNMQKIADMHPGCNVSFVDEEQCRSAIARAHSEELALWFDKENQWSYKSDMCRLAVLYQTGGYYFEGDFEVVTDVRHIVPPGASISTVMALTDGATPSIGLDGRLDVFNNFLAAAPKHPVIKAAMDLTLGWYMKDEYADEHNGQRLMWWNHPRRDGPCETIDPERCHQVLPGPVFLGKALRDWLKVDYLRVGHMDEGKGCEWTGDMMENRCAYLFIETDDIKAYNLAERNKGSGWPRCVEEPFHSWCNVAVTDGNQQLGWSHSPEAADFESSIFTYKGKKITRFTVSAR